MTNLQKSYTLPEIGIGAVVGMLLVAAIIVGTFPSTMFCVWAALKLYGWFAVPYLHVPAIPYWPAVGLWFLLAGVRAKYTSYKDDRKVNWLTTLLSPFTSWGMTLAIGWLIHTYLCR